MRVSEKYYDEIFEFKGQWDISSRCGLRILPAKTGRREKTIVIVTELYQDNPGTSITAAGKNLVEQICRVKDLCPGEIMYLQCNPDTGSKLSFYDEEFFEVDFANGAEPVYRQLSAREVEELF